MRKSLIDFMSLDLKDARAVSVFATGVARIGREAVAEAIADHKSAGNAIVYVTEGPTPYLVEEAPDGQIFPLNNGSSIDIVRISSPAAD